MYTFKPKDNEINTSNNDDEIVFFDNPISINAQSSNNKTG